MITVPGLTPTSPVMDVRPVLSTVEAPRMAKDLAAPREGPSTARAGSIPPAMTIPTAASSPAYFKDPLIPELL